MFRRFLILVLFALSVAAATAWWYSPARVVERRTESLLSHLSIQPNGGLAARQAVIYALDGLLAPTVTLTSPDLPFAQPDVSSQEISNAFALLAEHSQGTRFVRDSPMSVQIHGDQSTVDLTIHALIRMAGKDLVNGRYRIQLNWQHEGENWLLVRASAVPLPGTPSDQ